MEHIIRSILPNPPSPIIHVYPDVLVEQGVQMMTEANIGALVVADDENFLGVLSERDIIRGVVYKELSPANTKISDVMCADVTILDMADSLEKAMEAMTLTKRRHLLIKEDENIVAILSIGDVLFSLLEDKTRVIEQLKNYIAT